ncbi:MAG TPA: hypothetical protein VLU06_01475 [Thermoanaerobaculia bacterium]|nr:hypothetical protein [Thermoanaerobaculia bacterium]
MTGTLATLLPFWALAVATLGLCPPGGEPKRVSAGQWGAMGIAMEVTESGATIEYDCAHGTIDQPLVLDADGRFDVKGHHFREHGGPIREGEESRGEPVRYVGQVTGDSMTLTVKPEGSDSPIGNHQLVRGKMGRIHKCL